MSNVAQLKRNVKLAQGFHDIFKQIVKRDDTRSIPYYRGYQIEIISPADMFFQNKLTLGECDDMENRGETYIKMANCLSVVKLADIIYRNE